MAYSPADDIGRINKTLDVMRFDAKLHKSAAFNPSYDYNFSNLKKDFDKDLAPMLKDVPGQKGLPADIKTQVQGLEGHFKDSVRGLMDKDFKEGAFNKPLVDLQKSVETAQKADPDNSALNNLNAKLASIQADGLQQQLQQMSRALRLQNDLNLETALVNDNLSAEQRRMKVKNNDWVNLTNYDEYSKDELGEMLDQGVTLSSQQTMHNGADGVYSKPDSNYLVEKRTDKDGNTSYSATYSNVPNGALAQVGMGLVDLAMLYFRFYATATIVIPLLVMGINAIHQAATEGKQPPLLGDSLWSRFKNNESVFEGRQGTPRGEVKVEMDVARNRGKAREIVFDIPRQNKQMEPRDLEKMVVYIDEMKKRSGFQSGPPVEIKNKLKAMDFRLTIDAETKLKELAVNTKLTRETEKMVESFYRSQGDGTLKGYDPGRFKDYIFNEIKRYQEAFAPLRAPSQDNKQSSDMTPLKNDNTSVMTPAKPDLTSTITPGQPNLTSTITPAQQAATSTISISQQAPAQTATSTVTATDSPEQTAAAKALIKFGDAKKIPITGDNLREVIASAVENLDTEKVTNGGDWLGIELKQSVDEAVKSMSVAEVEQMEAAGELTTYRDFCATDFKDNTHRQSPLEVKLQGVAANPEPPVSKLKAIKLEEAAEPSAGNDTPAPPPTRSGPGGRSSA